MGVNYNPWNKVICDLAKPLLKLAYTENQILWSFGTIGTRKHRDMKCDLLRVVYYIVSILCQWWLVLDRTTACWLLSCSDILKMISLPGHLRSNGMSRCHLADSSIGFDMCIYFWIVCLEFLYRILTSVKFSFFCQRSTWCRMLHANISTLSSSMQCK